ncbi:MAG: hydroxymethylbilane synthase [Myxococcota bacterium]|nr:hydroxymethylbilane synthase [Myxococcota bacterium]
MKLVIGTRGSELALAQSHWVRRQLLDDADNGVDTVELKIIKTRGDKILDVALSKVGGKGLFVKELEIALLDGEVDLAVHSMKDMPSELPEGLVLGGVPSREDPRDAWVCPDGASVTPLADLPLGATVGTSSLRRQAQLLAGRPDLHVVPIRGTVGTRLAKLDAGQEGMVAIVLACAGLKRLGLQSRIHHAFAPSEMLPAVGQGALAIELRGGDERVAAAIAGLDHPATRWATLAERAFLGSLEGGCQVPIGGHAEIDGDELRIRGFVSRPDGRDALRLDARGAAADAIAIGRRLGDAMIAAGAEAILEAGRVAS